MDSVQADALVARAKLCDSKGNTDSMFIYYKQAQNLFRKTNCWRGLAKVSINLTLMYGRAQNVQAYEAELRFIQQLAATHLSPKDTFAGKIYQIIGSNQLKQQQVDSAIHYTEKARQIFKDGQAWKSYSIASQTLAQAAQFKQDFKLMERYINDAYGVIMSKMDGMPSHLAVVLQMYGGLYYRTGEYEKGLAKMQAGLETLRKNMTTRDDTVQLGNVYNNIGLLYLEIGDVFKSEDYYTNALAVAMQLGNYFGAATIYYNLAESFRVCGENQKAYENYKKGLELLKKSMAAKQNLVDGFSNVTRSQINLNNGLAEVAPALNQNIEAIEALTANLRLHKQDVYRQEETYRILGEFYQRNHAWKDASECLTRSLDLNRGVYGDFHPLVARAYYLMGELAQAQRQTAAALGYFQKAQTALLPTAPNSDLARLPDDDLISDRSTYLQVLQQKAIVLYELGQKKESFQTAQQALYLIDKMRNHVKAEGSKLFLQRRVMPIYEFNIRLALEQYNESRDEAYLNNAFSLMEKSKAMLLLDALKTENARNFGNIPNDLLNNERRLAREIAKNEKALFDAQQAKQDAAIQLAQKNLLELRTEAQKLQAYLEVNYKKYYDLRYKDNIVSLQEIRKGLDEHTQLLEFFIGNEHIYIFSVSQKAIKLLNIPKTEQFDNQIIALRTAITNVKLVESNPKVAYYLYTKNAYNVYEQYIKNALQPDLKRIVVVPDGLLNYIPLEALLTEKIVATDKDTTYSFRNLPYLIRSYTVNYTYSASLLHLERPALKTNRHILALAPSYQYAQPKEPNFDDIRQAGIRTKISELPGAHAELKMLQSKFVGTYLYDQDATEANFKQKTQSQAYSVIHLAMHGWVDNERPEYSSLLMTYDSDTTEDDMLHAYELNLLQLQADMVVLSACETGFGKFERGEGVVSIGRGFIYAGVPSLAMTLWSINDHATAALMNYFYDKLANGMPKDEALRAAKLDYLQNVTTDAATHPFYWASFITVGDERPVQLERVMAWWEYVLYGLGLMATAGGMFWLSRNKKAA